MTTRFTMISLALLASACAASSPPESPAGADRRAECQEHHEVAERHQLRSEVHGALYDPGKGAVMRPCSSAPDGICWDRVDNPTAEHARAAEDDRRRAAEHRARVSRAPECP